MKNLLLALILIPFASLNANPVEFYTDEESCDVKEIGSNGKVFEGKRWLVQNTHSGCTVTIEKQRFEEQFSMCYLTGMDFFERGHCRFRPLEQNYMFEFDDKATLNCRFTCIKL